MNANRIIVIEQGQVVEQGGHEELILAKGRYADLWSKQVFLSPVDNNDSSAIKASDAEDDKSL
jgi:ABC-type glutathione transport system ATPase component